MQTDCWFTFLLCGKKMELMLPKASVVKLNPLKRFHQAQTPC